MAELRYYINALYLSLYSRNFYAQLIGKGTALGVKYLLLLSLLLAVPMSLYAHRAITGFFASDSVSTQDNLNRISSQMPALKVEQGRIVMPFTYNHIISGSDGGDAVVFDVENKIDDLEMYDRILVVNAEGIRIKTAGGTAVFMASELEQILKQYFTPEKGGNRFNGEKFFSDMGKISATPFLFVLVICVFWYFMQCMVSALIYSFIVGMFISILQRGTKFDFRTCFRVAAFTSTPIALMEMTSIWMGQGIFAYASVVYFVTHMLYIYFAVESYTKRPAGAGSRESLYIFVYYWCCLSAAACSCASTISQYRFHLY